LKAEKSQRERPLVNLPEKNLPPESPRRKKKGLLGKKFTSDGAQSKRLHAGGIIKKRLGVTSKKAFLQENLLQALCA